MFTMTLAPARIYSPVALCAVRDSSGRMVPRLTIEADVQAGIPSKGCGARLRCEMRRNGGVPLGVRNETWAQAKQLDVDAMVEVNTLAPGCIYLDRTMLDWIITQSRIASYARSSVRDGDVEGTNAAQRAKNLLTKVCVPRVYSASKNTLGTLNLQLFPELYVDVVVIRTLYRHLKRMAEVELTAHRKNKGMQEAAHKQAVIAIKNAVPDLVHIRPEWLALLCRSPYGIKHSQQDDFKPVNVAAKIMGFALGYGQVTIRKAVKQALDVRMGSLRKAAVERATEVISRLETGGDGRRADPADRQDPRTVSPTPLPGRT